MSSTTSVDRVVSAVSEQRLWQSLMDLAEFGATPNDGVNRPALSDADTDAKNFVCNWAEARGLSTYQDEIGNLFVRYEGTEPDLDPVMVGSHLDSQPTGGRFDGAFGVMAGLEIIQALLSAGARPLRAVETVAWTNEEGSRFQPAMMGSSVYAGTRSLQQMLEVSDGTMTVGDALARSAAATRALHRPLDAVRPHSYVELHIEQGPILEAAHVAVGVVTAVQGMRRFNVEITGETAHAGTAPLRSRRDALVAAVNVMTALHEATRDPDDTTRFTIGRFDLSPGSPNTVPSGASFSIDLRHPNEATLVRMTDRIIQTVETHSTPCTGRVIPISADEPTTFDSELVQLVRETTAALGVDHMDIVSGAGHDSMHLARICPTAMIFAPCGGGVSHHEAESANPADLAAATRAAAATVLTLSLRS